MPLEPLLVDYSVGRVRPASDPWVPNLVILFLLAVVLGIAAALRLATILVRVRSRRGVAALGVRAPRSTGWRMRSRPRPPRPVGSLPFVVLALLTLQVRQFLIDLRLLPATELFEASHWVDAAYSSKCGCREKKDCPVVAFLFVQFLVKAHV